MPCGRCGRVLTVGELTSPAHERHQPDGHTQRVCGVCFYKHADPDDYGKPTLRGLLRIIRRRHRQPKERQRNG